MSRYDEKYEIRLATVNDIDMIMNFIDTEWKKGHILATNRKLFEYEFLEKDGTVNVVIAIDREKHTLEGMVGFLKASHDSSCMDIWGCMWKVREDNMALLGVKLIQRRDKLSGCRHDIGVGDNPNTAIPLFKSIMRRFVGQMEHFYRLADEREFIIAKIEHYPKEIGDNVSDAQIITFNNIDQLKECYDLTQNREHVPYKDDWYINHRFFNHLIYKYDVYGIKLKDEVKAVFVTRNQPLKDKTAVRVVDYIGDRSAFAYTYSFWKEVLAQEANEYVDFYCLGFEHEYLEKAGFTQRQENDTNIIPNYFSPFLQQNIDIWVDSTFDKTLFCKADGDQDRPS